MNQLGFVVKGRGHYMNEVINQRIVETAEQLFHVRGYKSVTMNDLSNALGMSKRTLYQYFRSKEEVATCVVDNLLQRITHPMDEIQLKPDPIKGLRETVNRVKDEYVQLNPVFLEDLQKSLPELWKRVENVRGEKFQKMVEAALQEAQNQGHALNFNPHVAAAVLVASAQAVIQPEFFIRNGFTANEVVDTLIGIFTTAFSVNGSD
ncbi:TetR/AcrR family transcriptional regulator [Alicyclobacillaceae bacterium I2511]|jgi:AcrR family transcriptional regulator|nr:TetR/AcrR family transcriptional regulator [Alicyclobacillaceae bacterium I2511]